MVLPVTWIAASARPSASRFCRARAVGANINVDSLSATRRFISSGNGLARSPVRKPASTCANLTRW